MEKIYCAVFTPSMEKQAKKLGIPVEQVVNLHSLYRSKYNKPNANPTTSALQALIDKNKEEVEKYKYTILTYKVSDKPINKAGDPIVELIENEFILHRVPKEISYEEVLNTWTAIPKILKSVIENKTDLYRVELWANMLLHSGLPDYNLRDNSNAGTNAYIAALKKLEEYKKLNPEPVEDKPYKEVDTLSNGALAVTSKKDGKIVVSIKKNITVEEFLDYIQGNIESKTSEQKKLVFENLKKLGITLEMIKENLNTSDKIKQFIYLHELNHIMNYEYDHSNYDFKNMNAQVNVDIETRATIYAWEQMFDKVANQSNQPKVVGLSQSGYRKGDPQRNSNVDYVFTDNAEAYMAATGYKPKKAKTPNFPYKQKPKLNVSDMGGNNQAGIRTDADGNITPNAYGIVVKKFQQDINGKFVAEPGQFQDTDEDFELFKELNENFFERLDNSHNKEIVFPSQIAKGKVALPKRFAKWLQQQLLDRYGIDSTVEINPRKDYNGYGLSLNTIKSTKKTIEKKEIKKEKLKKEEVENEPNEVPEIGIPIHSEGTIKVDKNSPRAALSKDMSPHEIYAREVLIARTFSSIVDSLLENAIDETRKKLNNANRPAVRLIYARQLALYTDPVKGRMELIKDVGIDEIIDQIKEELETWLDLDDEDIKYALGEQIDPEHVREAYQKMLDHFDVLFDEASPMIANNEGLRITRDSTKENAIEAQKTEVQEDDEDQILGDDENGNRVSGNTGWAFKIRFVDPHDSARAETKKALSDIKQLDSNGNLLVDDLGNPVYFREDFIHSTLLSIISKEVLESDDFCIKNKDGSYSFPILEKALKSHPWISQVINKLNSDPNLISIFYSDFRKNFVSYWTQKGDKLFPLNSPVAYDSTVKNVTMNYEQGKVQDSDSIFDVNTNLRTDKIEKGLNLINENLKLLQKLDDDELGDVVGETVKVLKMLGFSPHNIDVALLNSDRKILRSILDNAKDALDLAKKAKDTHYVDAAKEPISNIARLIGKVTELDAKTTFREHGATYPSYSTPNYIETLFGKLLNDRKRASILENEFGKYDWFKHNGKWCNEWLNLLENNKNVRDFFAIKNVFLLNGKKYNDWRPNEITAAFLKEYFAIPEDPKQTDQFAWFNAPIFSDTEMATFFKFKKYTGDFKKQMLPLFRNLVKQELRRIALVENRRAKGVASISNFDKRGSKFCFLPELNNFTVGSRSFLNAIRYYISQNDMRSVDNLIDSAIERIMETKTRDFLFKHAGTLKNEELIKFIQDSTHVEDITGKIEEYVWNQLYASSQIVQILTTDLAYYKNSVDFQKRFKEVYAAGTRLNTNSKYGRKYEKTIYIQDNIITSPTFLPLKELLDNAVKEGRMSKMDRDSILFSFRNINATDGQAYRSLSSYRSIMDMLGAWTEDMERAFNNFTTGNWDMGDLNVVFQTIKPFVYGQVPTPNGFGGLMKTPHQNKNSEFVLLATYTALGTALNNSPQFVEMNKFMEDYGIDVIQFESSTKVGGQGIINLNISPSAVQEAIKNGYITIGDKKYELPFIKGLYEENPNIGFIDVYDKIKDYFDDLLSDEKLTEEDYSNIIEYFSPKEGEVYETLVEATRKADENSTDVMDEEGFNTTTVHKISYDDYMVVTQNPEHLFDTEIIFGSQYRNLITADLPEDIEIEIDGKKIKGGENVKKFMQSLIVENLLDSYGDLKKDIGSIESLQKILLSMIKGNPKYGRDMLNALELVEYNGKKVFNIPFSDPIISTQFQMLLNSLFKNRITKQHMYGAACTVVSSFGFTNELRVVRKKDGSIEAFECYLPAYSKKMYEPFLTEEKVNDKVVGYKIDYDKLKKYGDPNLLDFIGYRIPTEGKYSMMPLRIIGFLPQQNGSSIMLPAEITDLSGMDFDK